MRRHDYTRLHRQRLIASHGAEDIVGRRLPGDDYRIPSTTPRLYRPRPSKAELRAQGEAAFLQWHGLAAPSSC
ncbi:hypothetical protein [Bradyrhizobium oligotrophicum]|uniref:hypothetical protein n=1 Tax=Bradyrhizobium oligotrophicum TaxID=44255 RepID=UPI003EBFE5F4